MKTRTDTKQTQDEMTRLVIDYVTREYLEGDDPAPIDAKTRLITGGIVDSFSMVSLKRFLERRFEIRIPDADASPEAFDTVDSIVALVERFRGEQHK